MPNMQSNIQQIIITMSLKITHEREAVRLFKLFIQIHTKGEFEGAYSENSYQDSGREKTSKKTIEENFAT